MCIGVPMKVITPGPGQTLCESKGAQRLIDTMLVGELEPGTWVMVFIDAAREVLTEEEALKIIDALQALEDVMGGSSNVDHLFADLIKH